MTDAAEKAWSSRQRWCVAGVLLAAAGSAVAQDVEPPAPDLLLGDHETARASRVTPLGWIEPGRVVRVCRLDREDGRLVLGAIVAWDLRTDTFEEVSSWVVEGLPFPSPDGRHATVYDIGWGLAEMRSEPQDGQPVKIRAKAISTPGQYTDDGNSMVFLPQATHEDRSLQVWDLESLSLRKEVPLGDVLGDALALSADGALAAVCGSYGHATVFDLRSGAIVASLDPGDVGSSFLLSRRAAFSADGTKLYHLVPDGRLLEWTLATKRKRELPSVVDVQRMTTQQSVVVTPPSAGRIAVVDSEPRLAIVRTAPFGLLRRVKLVAPAHEALLSDDGRFVVTSTGNRVSAHDTGTGKQVAGTVGHSAPVTQLRWQAGGKTLITLASSGSRIAWDARSGRAENADWIWPGELAGRLALSTDGRSIVHLVETDIEDRLSTLRNAEETPFLVAALGWGLATARLLPDAGGAIVENREGTATFVVFAGADGKESARVQVPLHSHAACRGGDGKLLLVASSAAVEAFDIETGKSVASVATEVAAVSPMISGDGQRAAWLEISNLTWESMDVALRVVSLPDLKTVDHDVLAEGAPRGGVRAWIAWHPTDGSLAVLGEPGVVTRRDIAAKRSSPLCTLPDGASPSCLSYAPDGQRLAVGLQDGRVCVWHLGP